MWQRNNRPAAPDRVSEKAPIPVKEAMAMLGNCTSEMREPLYPIDETKKAVLREKLTEAGLAVKN